jgi:hypothetical protein
MTERQREEWVCAMRHHQRELERLAASLASVALRTAISGDGVLEQATRSRPQEIFMNAQMIRHQISVALLASRLEAPLEA